MKKEDLLQDSIDKQLKNAKPIVTRKKEETGSANKFNKFVMVCLCISIIIGLIVTLMKVF